MIFHITFYRNTISFSVNHNFRSAYSTLSDTIGGHFWASKLLRTEPFGLEAPALEALFPVPSCCSLFIGRPGESVGNGRGWSELSCSVLMFSFLHLRTGVPTWLTHLGRTLD